MEQTDVRKGALNLLSHQVEDKAEHTMSRGVLWTEVKVEGTGLDSWYSFSRTVKRGGDGR